MILNIIYSFFAQYDIVNRHPLQFREYLYRVVGVPKIIFFLLPFFKPLKISLKFRLSPPLNRALNNRDPGCYLLVSYLVCNMKCSLQTQISVNVTISDASGAHLICNGETWEINEEEKACIVLSSFSSS